MVQEKQVILAATEKKFKAILARMYEEDEAKRKIDFSKFNDL
jgi:hypothetical protein